MRRVYSHSHLHGRRVSHELHGGLVVARGKAQAGGRALGQMEATCDSHSIRACLSRSGLDSVARKTAGVVATHCGLQGAEF